MGIQLLNVIMFSKAFYKIIYLHGKQNLK